MQHGFAVLSVAVLVGTIVSSTDQAVAAPLGCRLSNTTATNFGVVAAHSAAHVKAGSIVEHGDHGVEVRGSCSGQPLEIIDSSTGPRIIPFVAGTAAAATPTDELASVAAYLETASQERFPASELCIKHPPWDPQLTLVGRKSTGPCSLPVDVIERDVQGRWVPMDSGTREFGVWGEPVSEAAWAATGNTQTALALRWVVDVVWAFSSVTVLTAATADFRRSGAPRFFAPTATRHGDAIWVDAWRVGTELDRPVYVWSHVELSTKTHGWTQDEQVEILRIEDDQAWWVHRDHTVTRDGQRVTP